MSYEEELVIKVHFRFIDYWTNKNFLIQFAVLAHSQQWANVIINNSASNITFFHLFLVLFFHVHFFLNMKFHSYSRSIYHALRNGQNISRWSFEREIVRQHPTLSIPYNKLNTHLSPHQFFFNVTAGLIWWNIFPYILMQEIRWVKMGHLSCRKVDIFLNVLKDIT